MLTQRLRCLGALPMNNMVYSKMDPGVHGCQIASRLQNLSQIKAAPRKETDFGPVVAVQLRYTSQHRSYDECKFAALVSLDVLYDLIVHATSEHRLGGN